MSGLKPIIYEYCPLCGQKDAEVRGSAVWSGKHKCPHAPPGPRQPPRDHRLRDVVWMPRDEYDELHDEALRKHWKSPVTHAFPRESWAHYWRAKQEYERNPDAGRPVPPHRSAAQGEEV